VPLTRRDVCARARVRSSHHSLLLALVSLGVLLGPSCAQAAQLDLNWADHSDGQASFIIQRAADGSLSSGQYTQVAQVPVGVTSYTDTTVSLGTSYCYRVAAVEGRAVSSFSKIACAKPGGGFSLVVTKTGGAQATSTVASSPPGIDCGATCSYTYPAGKLITLTAAPSSGYVFTGWSRGGCSGTGPCTIVGNVPVTVTATFAPLSLPGSKTSATASSGKDGKK
jgi:hypothetical protein